ncbi:MAG: glycine--tRNA ligase [Dehalococcoidia bacterium]|nr:glycine--tRNA ligase [Dehalococcoidia bacterium]MQG04288.1 glycine--tRNA ligase [SAR202 cluster bacterium]
MVTLDAIVSLAKRRGFVFQGSEIYGGLRSVWDFGPLGIELKRTIKDVWWKHMIHQREDIEGIDSAILMHPSVWEASGHVSGFTDPLVECKTCHNRFREDQIEDIKICPEKGCEGKLTESKQFNLMFQTHMGPVQDKGSQIYLRPETAQGIFVNFENVMTSARKKIPFGIGQIGKSFRNEITPGNFIFRTREFEQMEMEFFCQPDSADEWFNYWIEFSHSWFELIGIKKSNLRKREHTTDERPHYAKAALDIEYNFPWGWGELETINNRSDHDLKSHSEKSGKDLSFFDEESKERYIPYVIEPAMGADRTVLAVICDAYDEEDLGDEKRSLLRFKPIISPIQVAVLPLSKNEKLAEVSNEIYKKLQKIYRCQFDNTQSIGKRYRRQDEIGTPICLTIDFDTVEKDQCVTLRHRDTMDQIRIKIEDIEKEIEKLFTTF